MAFSLWTSIIRQLIHRGYLEQDIANYSVLTLTAQARPLLRGEVRLELARPRIRQKAAKARKAGMQNLGPHDEGLFEELRALRKVLADAEGKPPYIVFGDATLVQMARERPLTEQDLLQISGVGQHKLEKYGGEFLDAIAAYCVGNQESAGSTLSALQSQAWEWYRQGSDLDTIATRSGIGLADAAELFIGLAKRGQPVDAQRLIAPRKYELIADILQDCDAEPAWQTLRDALPPLVADHEIRLVSSTW
jgi:ATP-dependent DNA helicase RecQ